MIVVVALAALLVVVPIVLLVLRFRSGEESVRGGSWGRQYFGRNGEDWGPKSP